MRIKKVDVFESSLDEENGEIIAKVVLLIEVEDDSRTSYVLELPISTPPINTWEVLDLKEKERQIKNSLRNRTY